MVEEWWREQLAAVKRSRVHELARLYLLFELQKERFPSLLVWEKADAPQVPWESVQVLLKRSGFELYFHYRDHCDRMEEKDIPGQIRNFVTKSSDVLADGLLINLTDLLSTALQHAIERHAAAADAENTDAA